jgi:large subunit ribosomal protein L10
MDKDKKIAIVGELTGALSNSEAVFVTDFKGLSMDTLNQLRQKIRAAGGHFKISKNTLTRIALGEGRLGSLKSHLTGNNALAYTDGDPVALAKVLSDFAKEQEKFSVKTGVLGSKPLRPEDVTILASLPSKQALLGSFLGTLAAVPGSFVRVLAGVPQKYLRLLTAIGKSRAS